MPRYVDGFVVPVPKKNVQAYRKISRMAGKVWREHGALAYVEAIGDELKTKGTAAFPKGIRSKPNEAIFFSYIVYKSKTHRNQVNAKVMKDPRLNAMMG